MGFRINEKLNNNNNHVKCPMTENVKILRTLLLAKSYTNNSTTNYIANICPAIHKLRIYGKSSY